MAVYAVTVVGIDQPGNLAAVAGALVEQGCHIDDSEMAILRGHSSMMLVVSPDADADAESLEDALAKAVVDRGLNVTVHPIDPGVSRGIREGEPWTVAIHGANRPGILYEVTRVLARANVNIVGLKTRVHEEAARPQYTMAFQVTVPPGVDGDEVAAQLDKLGGELNLACSMRPAPADGHGGGPAAGLRQSP
jgi:glycine cleavage system transcriptional repressor